MSLNPFPGGRCPTTNDLLVDRQLGQAYKTVKYVYDNWDVLKKNYDLLVLLPEAVWTFDPTDYATAVQGQLASTAVQPAQVSAVGFSGQYADLLNKPTLGTASTRDTDYFATAAQGLLAQNAIPNTQKGTANGVTPLGSDAKVPASFLPSYVDDVLEFASLANFPAVGETGKIYVTLDTNIIYRWSGSAYIEISPSPGSTDAVPEGSINRYFTDARAIAAATPAAIGAATAAQGAKADTAVQPAALAAKQDTPGAWTAPVYQNSFVDVGSGYGAGGHRVFAGKVEFRGVVASTSLPGTADTVMFTLPVGARPASSRIVYVGCDATLGGQPASQARIDILPNGNVVLTPAFTAISHLALDSVSFSL